MDKDRNKEQGVELGAELGAELRVAVGAALEAGEEILGIYEDPGADFEVERKADNSPLTVADRRANGVIMRWLEGTPYPVISEENRNREYAERRGWRRVWVVDPLDGTKEFIKRNGEFTVNIALVEEGVPVLGVVYVPVAGVLYYGTQEGGGYKIEGVGRGDWRGFCYGGKNVPGGQEGSAEECWRALEGRAVRLPEGVEGGKGRTGRGCVVVASRSHLSRETADYIEGLRREHGEVELVSVGSSIKICRVAEGRADVYPRFAPTMEWDTAAGHAVARAAGKELYSVEDGLPLRYNKEDLLNPWFVGK